MGEQRGGSSCLVSRPATLRKVSERTGIITAVSPIAGGSVGLIEGRNLRANYVIPLFTKFGAVPTDLMPGDLLVGKDGEPGTVALITKPLLDYCDALTLGGRVYRIRPAIHENDRHILGGGLLGRWKHSGSRPGLFAHGRIADALAHKTEFCFVFLQPEERSACMS